MDFFELKAFLVLADKLHFAKAAAEANLSPSALSRIITRLEEECKTSLFERDNRSCRLTENGEEFVEFARKTLEAQGQILDLFSVDQGEIKGVLRVFASVTACYTIMPPLIKKLNALYPKIQLVVETGDPALAVPSVREGKVDLAVAALPDSKNDSLEFFSVTKSPLVFVASSGGRFTKVNGSPQDIVSKVPLILPKAGLARERFDSWVKSRNVRPQIAAQAEGNEAVIALAALDMGIGLVPRIVLENGPYSSGFIFHDAGNAIGTYEIGFIRRKDPSGGKNARIIHEAVGNVLGELKKTNWK